MKNKINAYICNHESPARLQFPTWNVGGKPNENRGTPVESIKLDLGHFTGPTVKDLTPNESDFDPGNILKPPSGALIF